MHSPTKVSFVYIELASIKSLDEVSIVRIKVGGSLYPIIVMSPIIINSYYNRWSEAKSYPITVSTVSR
jgi:hypothetical protein